MSKILYIAGTGRSGSTLLDNVLHQIPGFTSVGEIRYVWDRGVLRNERCGCGQPFRECPFWLAVFDRAYGGSNESLARQLVKIRDQLRSRDLLGVGSAKHLLRARMDDYSRQLARLYHAIQEHSQCRVIVDSSKFPSHGFLLQQVPGIELYVLHLVRDARAVSFSWKRRKRYDRSAPRLIRPQSVLESSWRWITWNALTEFQWSGSSRYLRVRYEDFIRDPKRIVEQISQFVGEPVNELSFLTHGTADLAPNHSIAGNPSRFQHGPVKLRLDTEWEDSMKPLDKALATLMTWPLLLRYRYIRSGTALFD